MKKIGIILLVAILALGALGIGYAAWQDTVHINATAYTGHLELNILCPTEPTANVDYVTAVADSSDNHTMVVTITGAAPGTIVTIPTTIINVGSVPVDVTMGTAVITPTGSDITVGDTGFIPTLPATLVAAATTEGNVTITFGAVESDTVYTITLPFDGVLAAP